MILIKNHSQLKQVMIKIIPNEFIQPLSTIYSTPDFHLFSMQILHFTYILDRSL